MQPRVARTGASLDGESLSFVYDALAGRVLFGLGAARRLREEVGRLGARRLLLIAHDELERDVIDPIEDLVCRTISEPRVHVPLEGVEAAERLCDAVEPDIAVCIGGGSATGLGKALALRRGLAVLAVPTTYAGSEMTPIYGITAGEGKRTGRDPAVLPKTVVYDPLLTLSLPVAASAASGLNAIAHCVEALYAENWSPVPALMAAEGMRALIRGLPLVVESPTDVSARSDCLLGAHLAGAALGSSAMALHHRICHVLGGISRAGHGDLNAVVLPHVLAFNAPAAPAAVATVTEALAADDAAGGMFDFARRIGAPASLKEIGVPERALAPAAEAVAANPSPNPRSYTAQQVRALLDAMYEGVRPLEAWGA